MDIQQNNKHGDNTITFEIKGDFIEPIKEFKNVEDISKFIKNSKKYNRISIIFALLAFLLAPFYGPWILSIFN